MDQTLQVHVDKAPAARNLFQGLRQVQSTSDLENSQARGSSKFLDSLSPKSKKRSETVDSCNPLVAWRSYSSLKACAEKTNDEWTSSLLSRLQKRRSMSSSAFLRASTSTRLDSDLFEDSPGRPSSVFNLIGWTSLENLESNAAAAQDQWTSTLVLRMKERREKEDALRARRSRIISAARASHTGQIAAGLDLDENSEESRRISKRLSKEMVRRSSALSGTIESGFQSRETSKDGASDVPNRRMSYQMIKRQSFTEAGLDAFGEPLPGAKQTEEDKMKQRKATETDAACVKRVSVDLNCPPETVQEARDRFNTCAKREAGLNGLAYLDLNLFGKIVMQMMESSGQFLSPDQMERKIKSYWKEADRDGNQKVDFDEFAIWYSSWGFQQQMLLTPEQIVTRDLAKKYDLDAAQVDKVREKFDAFDEDGSGEIEHDEFEKLLYVLMKIPAKQELPASRVKHFWTECDLDGSGGIDFEEFLQWYMKYFDMDGSSEVSPMEQLYQSVRPNFGRPC